MDGEAELVLAGSEAVAHGHRHRRPRKLPTALALGLMLAGSAVLTGTTPAEAAPRDCGYGYLCVYDGTNFQNRLASYYYYCDFIDLQRSPIRDRITSYANNQIPGTRTYFYDVANGQWRLVWSSTAYDERANLRLNIGSDGHNMDNRIDGIRVC